MSAVAKPGTRHLKVCCEHCECILRMSRAAMLRHGMPTCGCGGGMYPADLAVAVDIGEEVAARCDDHRAALERHDRTIRRQAAKRVGATRSFQCGGCKKFVAAVNTTCTCGFSNAIRKGHNYGGYFGVEPDRERAARQQEARDIPF